MSSGAERLYAQAIAIEREAAERYNELAARMLLLGNEATAEVFARFALMEAEHLVALERRGGGSSLAVAAPAGVPAELVTRSLTPQGALQLALEAEQRAYTFFEQALMRAEDPALGALAREMAAEEAEHIEMLRNLLAGEPPHQPEDD